MPSAELKSAGGNCAACGTGNGRKKLCRLRKQKGQEKLCACGTGRGVIRNWKEQEGLDGCLRNRERQEETVPSAELKGAGGNCAVCGSRRGRRNCAPAEME